MRDILFFFDCKDVDISILLYRFFEPGGIRVLSNVDRCDSILYLPEKTNQCFQVGNLHIGDDEKIEIFPFFNQGN